MLLKFNVNVTYYFTISILFLRATNYKPYTISFKIHLYLFYLTPFSPTSVTATLMTSLFVSHLLIKVGMPAQQGSWDTRKSNLLNLLLMPYNPPRGHSWVSLQWIEPNGRQKYLSLLLPRGKKIFFVVIQKSKFGVISSKFQLKNYKFQIIFQEDTKSKRNYILGDALVCVCRFVIKISKTQDTSSLFVI